MEKALKTVGIIFGCVVVAFLVATLLRLSMLPWIYEKFLELFSYFGMGSNMKPMAVMFTAIALLVVPTLAGFVLFGKDKHEAVGIVVAGCLLFMVANYYFTKDVNFDRITKEPTKCYLKTLEGFKFSSECGFDPVTGGTFRKMNSEIQKEVFFWEKYGKMENIPSVEPGKYFHPLTGEPIVWYSERGNGEIILFPLPGFDEATGFNLKPITNEVINRLKAQSAKPLIAERPIIREPERPAIVEPAPRQERVNDPPVKPQSEYPAYNPKPQGSPGPPPPGHSGKTWILTFLGDQMGNPVSVSIGNNYVDIKGDGMDCSATKEKPGFFRGKGSKDGKYGDCSVIMGQYGGTGGWLINGEQINFELNKSG